MEEHQGEEVMDMSRLKKLDFNAPLLSTKRTGDFTSKETHRTNSKGASGNANEWVPFSWEVAPGKPKELQICDRIGEDIILPPKPPPGSKWHLSKEATTGDGDLDQESCQNHGHDDGCDGDLDDDDVLSLSEAIDIIEKAKNVHGLSSDIVESLGDQPPDFLIRRFLPDANALAASSSALAFSKNFNTQLPYLTNLPDDFYVEAQSGGQSYSSSTMGCGLETLFPWRTRFKTKPCGIKSPVRKCMADSKPQSSARRKQSSTFDQLRE